ncbi:MAG: MFS transporter, partial [Actinomycetota bacterium]|nr:MFS transporter [Actinomycetota bacterium]
ATALATIVTAASGSVAQAIILFEAALGLGIAAGPIVGGQLGSISWRGPFYGVAGLMLIALVATAIFLPKTPPTGRRTSLIDPFRALRYPGLLTIAITALFYNMGFFALLAWAPFPLDMSASQVGFIFFGWGLLLAFTSVWVAPRLQRACGSVPTVLGSLTLFAIDLAAMAVFTDSKAALVVGIIVAGAFLGINNTVITEAVMGAAPVERPVASAAYSFVRFSGGAVSPFVAGKLGENVSPSAPFWMGAGVVLISVVVLAAGRKFLTVDREPTPDGQAEADLIAVGDAS